MKRLGLVLAYWSVTAVFLWIAYQMAQTNLYCLDCRRGLALFVTIASCIMAPITFLIGTYAIVVPIKGSAK